MILTVDVEQEEDGRWIGEILELPGVLACGQARAEAVARVQALAFRVLADKLERDEVVPRIGSLFAVST